MGVRVESWVWRVEGGEGCAACPGGRGAKEAIADEHPARLAPKGLHFSSRGPLGLRWLGFQLRNDGQSGTISLSHGQSRGRRLELCRGEKSHLALLRVTAFGLRGPLGPRKKHNKTRCNIPSDYVLPTQMQSSRLPVCPPPAVNNRRPKGPRLLKCSPFGTRRAEGRNRPSPLGERGGAIYFSNTFSICKIW